jgi:uncharacterized protein YecE (DUF72 family)
VNAYVGTSGYSYDFWKGSFYPADIRNEDMLAAYATRLRSVEINNTFYRMPKRDVVKRWAEAVTPTFRFAIKASRRITHQKRLRDCEDDLTYMYSVLEPLEDRLGATLFQCAPHLRKDTELLRQFLTSLPDHARPVLELRHASWSCDEIHDLLREKGAVWCTVDHEGDADSTPLVRTADWGYVRLRAEDYTDEELQRWAVRLRETWPSVFVFFKHEETAPTLAERLMLAFDQA